MVSCRTGHVNWHGTFPITALSKHGKSFEGVGIAREFVGQKFQRDVAAKARVHGLVHYAHASAAEFLDDLVMGDDLAGQVLCFRDGARY